MSLIPSESFSFPDDFSRAISRARALHERERLARKGDSKAAPAPVKKQPAARASTPPKPEPSGEKVAPPAAQPAPPAETPTPRVQKTPPAVEKVAVRPAVPRKVPFRKNTGGSVAIPANARPPAGPKRFGPVRLTKSVRVPANVIVDLPKEAKQPAAAPAVVAADLPNEAEELVAAAAPRGRRRRRKLFRFLKIEIPALVVLGAAASAGLTHQFSNPIAVMILNAVTISAAFVVAITPIAIFAATPTLPPTQR